LRALVDSEPIQAMPPADFVSDRSRYVRRVVEKVGRQMRPIVNIGG
jgi:hypothetical protein